MMDTNIRCDGQTGTALNSISIKYEFHFENAPVRSYEMTFDADRMQLQAEHPEASPDWTKLGFHQCEHCPLDKSKVPYCPIARNLGDVAEYFKKDISFSKATIHVHTKERTFSKETDLQSGIQSIFGLIMATSGCPHMDFLKLMARYHQPFSSLDETTMRSLAFYMLKQLAKESLGKKGDFKLKNLSAQYEKVNTVNRGIIERLRSLGGGDADRNALVILDSFAQLMPMTIQSDLTEVAQRVLALSEES